MSTVVAMIVITVSLLLFTVFCGWLYSRVKHWVYALIWAIWCTVWLVVDVVGHDSVGAAINALVGSIWWYIFWKDKPPRSGERMKKLVGAKAKAIKQKIIDSMPKASPAGKPVLIPVGA